MEKRSMFRSCTLPEFCSREASRCASHPTCCHASFTCCMLCLGRRTLDLQASHRQYKGELHHGLQETFSQERDEKIVAKDRRQQEVEMLSRNLTWDGDFG
eukprot:4509594-Amphidinium_carterae.1